MSTLREELIHATIRRAILLIDYDIHNNVHKKYEFIKQTILADSSLTNDEKNKAIRYHNKSYDMQKISCNEGTKRICEYCNRKCLATEYCEYCVQDYLKSKFSTWTSGNNDIDHLIQKCQIEALHPQMIVDWIPYNNLKNIKYLTKGGFRALISFGNYQTIPTSFGIGAVSVL
ncbi:hypothetical protein RclHR1_11000001 [Rhizophagus clarus]|uniref:Kinase-like domain-containing protein n=1 Tax=Rhizophagus clarus TaxID=94130 RepID=A0A2Z6Q4R5_9GLOM|nr:hypothetical protein RclHR1_11000001 [Rhizophagus clarus]GES76284.1 kinase-like domain-containing protein [Rhizophagus clarus]